MDHRRISEFVSVKAVAKRAVRQYGVTTSRFRCLPDFLIIGAKRAGSTSLWNSVVRHPDVMAMFPGRLKLKGTGYFSINYERGPEWYRSHFPLRMTQAVRSRGARTAIVGEATPYYLYHPLAPSRASQLLPDARLIAILRNPADRAYSHYRERVRHGAERLSFEEALDAEEERLAGEEERLRADPGYRSTSHEDLSYVRQGGYADALGRWLAEFDRRQLLVILNEEFDRARERQLDRVWAFLDVPSWQPPRIQRYNYHPSEPMRPQTRARLLEAFREHNRELERLLGLDLSDWDE